MNRLQRYLILKYHLITAFTCRYYHCHHHYYYFLLYLDAFILKKNFFCTSCTILIF